MPLIAFERTFGARGQPAGVRARRRDVAMTAAAEDHARISMRARRHLGPGPPTPSTSSRRKRRAASSRRSPAPRGGRSADLADGAARRHRGGHQHDARVGHPAHARDRHPPRRRRRAAAASWSRRSPSRAWSRWRAGSRGSPPRSRCWRWPAAAPGFRSTGVPTALGSLVAAALSGIAAGWYPARRAASIDVVSRAEAGMMARSGPEAIAEPAALALDSLRTAARPARRSPSPASSSASSPSCSSRRCWPTSATRSRSCSAISAPTTSSPST